MHLARPKVAPLIPPALHDLRRRIDAVDDRILDLLTERVRIAREVAACKRRHGIAARLPERIQAVMDRCAGAGAARGLDRDYVRQIWAVVIEETCRIEEQVLASMPSDRERP